MRFEEVLALLGSLRIEPVFAAHSMESTRRTLLRKQQRVAQHLLDRLDPMLTPQDSRNLWSSIRVELTTAWQTEELPRERLTVGDEREQVLFYLIEILYRVVPAFYEEIAQALEKRYGVPADSIELPPILRFGSWVGWRHGRQPGRARQDDSRDARPAAADDPQQLLRGLPQALPTPVAERRAGRGIRGAEHSGWRIT